MKSLLNRAMTKFRSSLAAEFAGFGKEEHCRGMAHGLVVGLIFIILLLSLVGCAARDDTATAFEEDEAEHVLAFVLDISGSFQTEMLGGDGKEGRAFRHFAAIKDEFFKDRQMSKDRI